MQDLFDKIYKSKGPLGKWASIAEGYFVFPKLEGPISNRMMFNGKEVKKRNYFSKYGDQARKVLEVLLDKYADTGTQYIEVLQKIIEQNNLKDFDEARLLPSSKDLESLI